MTPDPVAWVSRSIGCCCRLKKRRNKGSCNNGLSSRTRPRTEMPTTPGVTRLTTGAMLCIGAPASTKQGTPVIRAIPPDRTSADKTRFMAFEILNGVVPPFLGERHPSCIGFRCYLSNPLRHCFKRSAGPAWQQPRREAANYLLYMVFLEKEQSIGHARSTG